MLGVDLERKPFVIEGRLEEVLEKARPLAQAEAMVADAREQLAIAEEECRRGGRRASSLALLATSEYNLAQRVFAQAHAKSSFFPDIEDLRECLELYRRACTNYRTGNDQKALSWALQEHGELCYLLARETRTAIQNRAEEGSWEKSVEPLVIEAATAWSELMGVCGFADGVVGEEPVDKTTAGLVGDALFNLACVIAYTCEAFGDPSLAKKSARVFHKAASWYAIDRERTGDRVTSLARSGRMLGEAALVDPECGDLNEAIERIEEAIAVGWPDGKCSDEDVDTRLILMGCLLGRASSEASCENKDADRVLREADALVLRIEQVGLEDSLRSVERTMGAIALARCAALGMCIESWGEKRANAAKEMVELATRAVNAFPGPGSDEGKWARLLLDESNDLINQLRLAEELDRPRKKVRESLFGTTDEGQVSRARGTPKTKGTVREDFADAVRAARARLVRNGTDADIDTLTELLESAKAGVKRSQREDFVVDVREMLDCTLLDIFDAKTGDKLTLTMKYGQAYLQGGGTSRTLDEVDLEIRPRLRPTFAKRKSRAKGISHSPEAD